jgi:cytochrome c nitrite reductase small subunit
MSSASRLWLLIAGISGILSGLGAFTFLYARGYSYLRDDPGACGNCHIMSEHLGAWEKGSHRAVATCNDCHTPHEVLAKYVVKARNGFWHSFYFTTGRYPDPLRITAPNHRVTEEACRYCHGELTLAIEHGMEREATAPTPEPVTCTRCHRYVGHWVR